MNIVVTGATSFIGVPVIMRLLQLGHTVFAVVRPGSAHRNLLPKEYEHFYVIEKSLEDTDSLYKNIPVSCHSFLHLGWDGAGSGNRTDRQVQQKNVDDSIKALTGAARLGCNRFLFSGSQAEYGICRELMKESMVCQPVSEYGKAKVDFAARAERLCESWSASGEYSIHYIHARIFSIFGSGDHPYSLVESCLDSFLSGEEISLGACTQLWNFLYIDDLVEALLRLLVEPGILMNLEDRAKAAVFNIAGEASWTRPLKDYVTVMHRLCKKNGEPHFGVRPPNAEGIANLNPDITKLKQAAGWKPEITFEEGINRMLELRKQIR